MRVSTSILAAGFAASALAAPRTHHHKSQPATAVAAVTPAAKAGGLQFLGASESGAEFGEGNLPGVVGKDYIFPDTASIKALMDLGMNVFRIPFLMERLAQNGMTSKLDPTYLASLKTVVKFITDAGKHAVLDPHNYARYHGSVITNTADFKTFWANVAAEFAGNPNVIFDCINEPHDMPTATLTAELNQACVDGVRGAGAKSQYIFVEGTQWTGAWSWTTSGNSQNMGNIKDTVEGKLVYEMHQYLDGDSSGTSENCVSSTIGVERIAAATKWLRDNNKVGIIGEFAGGANAQCEAAVEGLLDNLGQNSDVWLGAMWWGAGPWWGNYMYSMEAPNGVGYTTYKNILSKYAPK